MDLQEMIAEARDVITVKRVFGDPYEKDGVTIIPAATVQGGGGGGGGEGPTGQGKGEGGRFGLSARPAGAYVINNGEVTWQPAVDVNRGGGCGRGGGHGGLPDAPIHRQGASQGEASQGLMPRWR